MNILDDNSGQGAAEYILLFGGVIVIAVAALAIYKGYFSPGVNPYRATSDLNLFRGSVGS